MGYRIRSRCSSTVATKFRYGAVVNIPSPPLEERARERRPSVSKFLCHNGSEAKTGARCLVVLLWFLACARLWSFAADAAEGLEKGFLQPPASARPWVYWFWLNGNITKAGITADLEAMKRAGIGGVIIMDVVERFAPPPGPADFMNAEWQELFCFAVAEAHRLGL